MYNNYSVKDKKKRKTIARVISVFISMLAVLMIVSLRCQINVAAEMDSLNSIEDNEDKDNKRLASVGLADAVINLDGPKSERELAGEPEQELAGEPERNLVGEPELAGELEQELAGEPEPELDGELERDLAGEPEPAGELEQELAGETRLVSMGELDLVPTEKPGLSPTSATELISGGTFVISVLPGSFAVGVNNNSALAGEEIIIDSNDGSASLKWVLQYQSDGFYYIRNLHSWKVLDCMDGNVFQANASGSLSQFWKIEEQYGGGFILVNARGEYLRLPEEKLSPGMNVITGQYNTETFNAFHKSFGMGCLNCKVWYLNEVDPETELDFKTDGTQTVGIRTFEINKGNVTEISEYYPIQTEVNLPDGGYYLSGGNNYSIGIKSLYVNYYLALAGYLGYGYASYCRYDTNTTWAVIRFQIDNGLVVDGIVGLNTWLAMGYTEDEFNNIGAYVTELKVPAYGSSAETYANAMLETAREYAEAGKRFVDGASGAPGTFIDCSGLIFQCLYSAGINPDVNIIDHARVAYEYTSYNLGNDSRLGLAVAYAQPGDIIFYGWNYIHHVGIYAGNGLIYDATPEYGVCLRSVYIENILRIVRVF